MQNGLNRVTNLMCSVGYEASTANQSKQLKIFDIRNHHDLSFLCSYSTPIIDQCQPLGARKTSLQYRKLSLNLYGINTYVKVGPPRSP